MEIKNINGYEFLTFQNDCAEIVFSTSKQGLNLNKNLNIGLENLDKVKGFFKLDNIEYLNQIHSDIIYSYNEKSIKELDGDSIITNKRNIGIGIFTADCVPVIIVDNKEKVIAAIHSGWKGTYEKIVLKTINKMVKDYNINPKDLSIYIGPHNRSCCYEVSQELIEKFKNLDIYKNININQGRYLDLEKCIFAQLALIGVEKENINTIKLCTYCCENYKLYSYRKIDEREGRLFSFVYMK
ncbi:MULTISPECIES: peptidoglycan editing factor PgeF [Clostridium]|uniref:Purine nucleoside phosphorylase n=1 Tax=Clostridium senegalense TaxID=1465809 RepID=A0A6M0GZA3_9CLOT|nr:MULTISPECIES: peptidoglycan editing factor PgeF [Clostridium]NEU03825.1 peptidoglycan editing factor PgeF [Clostridium senegalense]